MKRTLKNEALHELGVTHQEFTTDKTPSLDLLMVHLYFEHFA